MKVWTTVKFAGHNPVGTAAVVAAETAEDAAYYLNDALSDLELGSVTPDDMEEFEVVDGQYSILADGNY